MSIRALIRPASAQSILESTRVAGLDERTDYSNRCLTLRPNLCEVRSAWAAQFPLEVQEASTSQLDVLIPPSAAIIPLSHVRESEDRLALDS
jgi:hypothetical protein